MHHCPSCQSENICRSRSRSRWESWRKEITGKRVYRCQVCGWRGWGLDTGPRFDKGQEAEAARALAPQPPNLKAILSDTVSRQEPIALDELDVLEPITPPIVRRDKP